jgi:hypothetical protein
MTVDGGVLLYGVGGKDRTRPDVREPFDRAGAAERIDQVSQTGIQEPPVIDIRDIDSEERPGKGYLAVVVGVTTSAARGSTATWRSWRRLSGPARPTPRAMPRPCGSGSAARTGSASSPSGRPSWPACCSQIRPTTWRSTSSSPRSGRVPCRRLGATVRCRRACWGDAEPVLEPVAELVRAGRVVAPRLAGRDAADAARRRPSRRGGSARRWPLAELRPSKTAYQPRTALLPESLPVDAQRLNSVQCRGLTSAAGHWPSA